MAQITGTLYNTIADAYSAIDVSLSGIQTQARVALDAIVDVDTLDYPQASTADADAALEIELALLQTFNSAYIVAGNIVGSNSGLLQAVNAVNDFVITNQANLSVVSGTATEKLDYWIETQMADYWTGLTPPAGWKNICGDAGYDTTNWSDPA